MLIAGHGSQAKPKGEQAHVRNPSLSPAASTGLRSRGEWKTFSMLIKRFHKRESGRLVLIFRLYVGQVLLFVSNSSVFFFFFLN
jgi:hypothetical protein